MKRIAYIFLMTMAILPATIFAQTDVWDGSAEQWTQGSGTEADPYLIETAENLAWIAEMVNSGVTTYAGVYFKLTSNLNMNNIAWVPIGNSTTQLFCGQFDGNNKSISTIKITGSYTHEGLFGITGNGFRCRNLGVTTTASSTGIYCGGIVGYINGSNTVVENCYHTGSVSSTSTSTGSFSGGIVGYINATTNIANCYNTGTVSSCYASGGIVSYINATTNITNCYNTGTVSSSSSSSSPSIASYSGGIVANISTNSTNTNIADCYNTGTVSSSKNNSSCSSCSASSYSGGIVGRNQATTTLNKCYNKKTITSTAHSGSSGTLESYSGGLVGYGGSKITLTNSYNRGDIRAYAYYGSNNTVGSTRQVGGVIGAIGSSSSAIRNCYNTGTLTGGSLGGIRGNATGSVSNCYYLETCGGTVSGGTSKTDAAMKSTSFPILLNADSNVFVMDVTPTVNDGYPIFGSSVCTVTTLSATNLDFTSAKLRGSYVNGELWSGTVDMQGFEWKAATASEWDTVYTNVGTTASYNLSGLAVATNYQYRMFVKIGNVTIYGNTVNFTTRACNASVSITPATTQFCSNTSVTLNASASSQGSISTYAWSNNSTASSITVRSAGTYRVTVTDQYGCTASASRTLSRLDAPTAAISGNAYICTGNNTTLTASGGVGYVWSTGATTPSINVSEPNEYYVVARASNGCTDTAYVTVANFNEVVISGNTSICAGESTTLSVTECTSYLWSTGETTQSIEVSTEGLYSVTATNAQCEANTSVYVAVNALPTPTITGTTAICGGTSTTLTANGGTSYAWNNGANTQSIEASSAGAYTVTVTNATGCTASAVTSVVSAPNPSVQISGNLTACQGESVTLTASGGTSYNWSNSANTASINPTQSGTYIVTAYNVLGCEATASAEVVISPNPQLNITAPQTICNNGSAVLSVSDNLGTTLTSCVWSNGGSGTSISVSPTATTNYTVTVTNSNGCTAQASTSVAVAEQLSLSLAGNTSICGNESATLTVSGISPSNVSTYAWSNGANTASVSVSASGTYSVIVTDVNGCTGYATTTVSAAENPVASISGQQSVCSGSSATLLASGGTSYQWSDGSTDASISVTTGGTYTVVVTNGAGCTATASAMVTVNESPSPQINGTLSICEGESTTLSVTGGDSFVWSNGSTSANINVTSSGNYSVIASNSNGCTASASAIVNVMENPTVTISGEPSMCVGSATYLTAEGGVSYVWSNGFQGSNINVSEAGTYSVIATGTNGCTSSASMAVVQYSAPEVTISGNTTVCEGSNETLTASGGVSYVWSTGETSSAISVNAFGIYSVTATGNGGCTSTANVTVFVASAPNPVINGNLHICDGEPTTLTANGGETYMWSNGSTANSIDVSNGGTYSVIATNENGCTAMASANVEDGHSVTNAITENTDGEFVWNGQTYTESGNYVQTFTAANGCDSVVTLHLTVNSVQHYNIFVISNNNAYGTTTGTGVYEANTEIQISATANDGYEFLSWNDGNTDTLRTITVTGDATYIATFIPATNIEENVALEIALFPNPATDILNITSSETISEIEIVNTLGQVVKRIEVNADNAVCDVEDLKAGVYVVRIHTEGAVVSQRKFIKE